MDRIRFKYLPIYNLKNRVIVEAVLDRYNLIDNPIGVLNLPIGEYVIRGNKRGCRKVYWHLGNEQWILHDETLEGSEEIRYHYDYDANKYLLFPNLSEREWKSLYPHYNKLNSYWKRAYKGHAFYIMLIKKRRETKILQNRILKGEDWYLQKK